MWELKHQLFVNPFYLGTALFLGNASRSSITGPGGGPRPEGQGRTTRVGKQKIDVPVQVP